MPDCKVSRVCVVFILLVIAGASLTNYLVLKALEEVTSQVKEMQDGGSAKVDK